MTGKCPRPSARPSTRSSHVVGAALHVEHLCVALRQPRLHVGGEGRDRRTRRTRGAGAVAVPARPVWSDCPNRRHGLPSVACASATGPGGRREDGLGFISGDRNRDRSSDTDRSARTSTARGWLRNPTSTRSPAPGSTGRRRRSWRSMRSRSGASTTRSPPFPAGTSRRSLFGRWSFVAPRILLLDDPTKGVDVTTRREMPPVPAQAAGGGTTVLLVSSDNDELLESPTESSSSSRENPRGPRRGVQDGRASGVLHAGTGMSRNTRGSRNR